MADVSISLDLNAEEFKSGLQEASGKVAQFANATEKSGGSFNVVTASQENFLRSNHRVASQIETFTRSLAAGTSGAALFASGLSTLERSFNLPLGALIGLGIAAELGKEFQKILSEEDKLRKSLDDLGKPIAYDFTSIDELTERLKKISVLAEEARNHIGAPDLISQAAHTPRNVAVGIGDEVKEHPIGSLVTAITDPLGFLKKVFDRGTESNVKDLKKSQEDAQITEDALGEKALKKAAIDRQIEENPRQGALDKSKSEFEEKKGKIVANTAIGTNRDKELDALEQEHAREQDHINRKFDAKNREVALEEKISAIKLAGRDVEIESAKAKVDAAQQTLAAANKEGKGAAQAKVDAAKVELEHAKEVTAHKRAHQDLERASADLTGTADEKRLGALQLQEAALRKQLTSAKPDEARDLSADLDKNLGAQRELELKNADKEQKQGLKSLTREAQGREREADDYKVTLSDLAKSNIIGGPGATARDAVREEKLSKEAATRGDLAGAEEHYNRAQRIKDSLPTLKDSEKSREFKKALDDSNLLKEIAKNTKDGGTNN